jgi:hypothetical protein
MADLGTVTLTEETISTVRKVKFEWTSEGTGANSGKATKTTTKAYSGEIIRFVTIPDGTAAPSASYDVVVNDEDGTDVLMGAGADRSATATEQVLATNLGCVANDTLSLSITSAGETKKGTAILYIR